MKKNKGFTLLELVISLALISMVILVSTQFLSFAIKGHNRSFNEFDIQSNIRIVSQNINNIIRDSSGVFILHRENDSNLTEEWNYIMLSPDKTRLLHYVWDGASNKHTVKELFPAIDGVKLDLTLDHDVSSTIFNKILGLKISIDGLGESRLIETEIEAKNALQVVDRSYLNKANTISYRKDIRLDQVSNSQAVVGMVLDKSGSMRDRMDGGNAKDDDTNSASHSRMKLMKNEAIRLAEGLSDLPNVYLGITPFDATANSTQPMMNVKQEMDTSPGIRSIINGLTASGGTNTGDGIRRSYYTIKDFNESHPDRTNKNFMIILVDGVTTFASVHEVVRAHSISFDEDKGPTVIQDGKEYNFSHTTGILWWRRYHYSYSGDEYEDFVTGDGNIVHTRLTASNYNTHYTNGGYFGHGSNLDPYGTAYVDLIGSMVKNYKEGTNEAIQVYVIGFSAVSADFGSLEDIAKATTGDTVYYEAGSAEALEEIFKAIQRDISDALWHIGGPN